jgi:hypothetical protein
MANTSSGTSKTRIWAGRILGTVSVLFFLMDAGMKLAKPSFVVAATVQLGYPESTINLIFPVIFATIVWASLVLRNECLESVLFREE